MTDPRFNDISCKLRNLARNLEAQAADHRKLADQLDIATRAKPAPYNRPQYLVAMDAAAQHLIHLPAAEIRTAAPAVAHAHGLQVLPVAIHAQKLRAEARESRRRAQTLDLLARLAHGATLKDAAEAIGVSEATGRRLRDAWRDQ